MSFRFHNASSLPEQMARTAAERAHEAGTRLFVVRHGKGYRVLTVSEWAREGCPAKVAKATPGGIVGEA